MPSSLRTGAAWRMAGWKAGANMKPIPTSSMHRWTPSGPRSITTPKASSTSALPQDPETARLPCLATLSPAAAATKAAAVDTLKLHLPSPPVPAVSTSVPTTSTFSAFSRITVAMPAISSGVSPLARRAARNAPNWAGVDSPSMTCRITAAASSMLMERPTTSVSMASLIISTSTYRGWCQEVNAHRHPGLPRSRGKGRPVEGALPCSLSGGAWLSSPKVLGRSDPNDGHLVASHGLGPRLALF